jgi:hypothetical protein
VSATCRAVLFTGRESYELREYLVPDPPAVGAVLRVEAVDMCGTDLAQWHGLVTLDTDHIDDAINLLLRRDATRDVVRASLRHTC